MELFGSHILDFPDDGESFLGRLPRLSVSEYFEDLGLELNNSKDNQETGINKVNFEENDDAESNDSAVFSEDVRSEGDFSTGTDFDVLQEDEDSYLCSAVAFDEVCKQDTNKVIKDNELIKDLKSEIDSNDKHDHNQELANDDQELLSDLFVPSIQDIIAEDSGGGGGGSMKSLDETGFTSSYSTAPCSMVGESGITSINDITDTNSTEQLDSKSIIVPDYNNFDSSSSLLPPDSDLHLPLSFENILFEDQNSFSVETISNDTVTEDPSSVALCSIGDLLKENIESEKSKLTSLNDILEEGKSLDKDLNLVNNITDSLGANENNYDLDFDFNLDNLSPESASLEGSLEGDSSAASDVDDLLSMFGVDEDQLLNSILADERIDDDYFDIDSVDPTCVSNQELKTDNKDLLEDLIKDIKEDIKEVLLKDIKQEIKDPEIVEPPQLIVNIKKEPVDEEDSVVNNYVLREHDYALPHSSSLFLTPPHSPGDDHPSSKSLVKSKAQPRSQIVKFNKPRDAKFAMKLPVRSGESLLKSKIFKHSKSSLKTNSHPKTANKLVLETILKKKHIAKHIQEKKEAVKNIKKRLREENLVDNEEFASKSKYFCIDDLRSKVDRNKYRKFEEERELHNQMERQRRIEMKEAYDILKEVIPEIANVEKVSKLNILNTARKTVRLMQNKLERLQSCKQNELDRRRSLQLRLSQLERE